MLLSEFDYKMLYDSLVYIYFAITNLLNYWLICILIRMPLPHVVFSNKKCVTLTSASLHSDDKSEFNNIKCCKYFSKKSISNYFNSTIDKYVDNYKYKSIIEFIHVEILFTSGVEIDVTWQIKFLLNNNYINIPNILLYFPDTAYIIFIYRYNTEKEILKKIIDIKHRFDIFNNKKCSFGKVKL